MEPRKGVLAVSLLVFTLAFVTASSSAETKKDVGGVADKCKNGVDVIVALIETLAEKNHKTQVLWDFWQCLGDTELQQDAYAVCDIIGNIISNITHLEMARDYFIEKQTYAACELCDRAAAQTQSFSDNDIKLLLQWIESRIKDPVSALAFREHGPALVTTVLESLYPYETCSYLNNLCANGDGEASKIPDFLKEILKNVTYCVECNACENAVLFAEMEILPNPKLPSCIVSLVQDNVCILLNTTLPGIGNDGYELCTSLINQLVGNIVNALSTFLHPNLVCDSVLKVCDAEHGDDILECVCDNVKLPELLNWLMPCRWQRDTS